jgi:hypothetical protein
LNGEILKERGNDGTETTITLKSVCINALLAQYPNEKDLSGVEKFRRFDLARQINSGVEEMPVEDVSLLKDLVGKAFMPIVVGSAWELMDGKNFQ